MVERSQLIAWGGAGAVHVVLVVILASIGFQARQYVPDPDPIEIAIVLPPPPPQTEAEEVEPTRQVVQESNMSPAPAPAPVREEVVELPADDAGVEASPVPAQSHVAVSPGAMAPYRETPPGPVQQTLRAFQCARLSPSQRRLCPTEDLEDEFLSVMVAEAQGAEKLYDPVLNVYRARTLLERAGGARQTGMFSSADNASTLTTSSTADAATSGLSMLLNSNPDPVFDGARDAGWDSDAGRPGK